MINVIDKSFYNEETINMIDGFNNMTKSVVENNELSEVNVAFANTKNQSRAVIYEFVK